jgi:hypothetical protein
MIGSHIGVILIVTGIITAVPVLQFFFPRTVLKLLSKVTVSEDSGMFFARHWGLCTLTIGALLVFAGYHPEARDPIVAAILVEKVGYAGLVFASWNKLPGLRFSGVFDAAASGVYLAYLLGA